MGIRQAADEHAAHALLLKTRVDEGPKQDTADLPIETGHMRGVSGGELHTGCICRRSPKNAEI